MWLVAGVSAHRGKGQSERVAGQGSGEGSGSTGVNRYIALRSWTMLSVACLALAACSAQAAPPVGGSAATSGVLASPKPSSAVPVATATAMNDAVKPGDCLLIPTAPGATMESVACSSTHQLEVYAVHSATKAMSSAAAANNVKAFDAAAARLPHCASADNGYDDYLGTSLRRGAIPTRFWPVDLPPTLAQFRAGLTVPVCAVALIQALSPKGKPTWADLSTSVRGALKGKVTLHDLWPYATCYADVRTTTTGLTTCPAASATGWVHVLDSSAPLAAGAAYPGMSTTERLAKSACQAVASRLATSRAQWWVFWPERQKWAQGDHGADCYIQIAYAHI